jgi:1,4-dihydroxy-2-naphthoate octaprenyltransferase
MTTKTLSPQKALLHAIRPPTLLVGLAPVLIGLTFGLATLSDQGRQLDSRNLFFAVAAVLLVLFLQSAANLVNDAKDADRGVDTHERFGPVRVVQSGLLSKRAVRLTYGFCFALAFFLVIGMFFWNQDWLIITVAAASALAAFAYTAGPFPLSYYALGEFTAWLFFGPIAVMGTAYLQTQTLDWSVAFWGLGSGAIAAAIMAINNYRDVDGDRRAGKSTLATLFGSKIGRRLPIFFLSIGVATLFAYCLNKDLVVLAGVCLLLCLLYIGVRILPHMRKQGAELNKALKASALFNLLYAILFVVCILLGRK